MMKSSRFEFTYFSILVDPLHPKTETVLPQIFQIWGWIKKALFHEQILFVKQGIKA